MDFFLHLTTFCFKGGAIPALFIPIYHPYNIRMPLLYDPLYDLTRCGAVPHIVTAADGTKSIRLTWRRDARYDAQRKGKAILARFERLILMQLDVGEGEKPRTIQQLVASRRVLVVNGRYKLPG